MGNGVCVADIFWMVGVVRRQRAPKDGILFALDHVEQLSHIERKILAVALCGCQRVAVRHNSYAIARYPYGELQAHNLAVTRHHLVLLLK